MGASAEVVAVGVVVLLLVLLVGDPALAPLVAGVELELDELPFELPVELVELPFELVGDGLCDELAGVLEGLVQVASGSTYCWLPAEGAQPLWASAAELMLSPSASDTRMPMTIWEDRVMRRYSSNAAKRTRPRRLGPRLATTAWGPPNPAALQ